MGEVTNRTYAILNLCILSRSYRLGSGLWGEVDFVLHATRQCKCHTWCCPGFRGRPGYETRSDDGLFSERIPESASRVQHPRRLPWERSKRRWTDPSIYAHGHTLQPRSPEGDSQVRAGQTNAWCWGSRAPGSDKENGRHDPAGARIHQISTQKAKRRLSSASPGSEKGWESFQNRHDEGISRSLPSMRPQRRVGATTEWHGRKWRYRRACHPTPIIGAETCTRNHVRFQLEVKLRRSDQPQDPSRGWFGPSGVLPWSTSCENIVAVAIAVPQEAR